MLFIVLTKTLDINQKQTKITKEKKELITMPILDR